jgi:hypothetical protein
LKTIQGMTGYDGYDALLYFFAHIARVKDKKWGNPSYASLVSLDLASREAKCRPHAQTSARRVGLTHAFRLAIRNLTNEFVIRDSAKASNRDKHLAAPSNHSLTAVGFCSVLRGAA